MDQKEKSFIELYSLVVRTVSKNDKSFYIKLQEVLKNKQKVDMQALSHQPAQVNTLIKEKEKL